MLLQSLTPDALLRRKNNLRIYKAPAGTIDCIWKCCPMSRPDLVEALRDEFHFPGMKVLQFGYGDMTDVKYIPQFYDTTNCVCYTGTHDNETTLGWYLHQSEEVKDRIRRTGNCDGSGVSLDFIRFALGSIAKYAIFPIQDLLQLDNEARMNTPGVAAANWAFRYEQWQLDEAWRKDWLKIYTKVFGR